MFLQVIFYLKTKKKQVKSTFQKSNNQNPKKIQRIFQAFQILQKNLKKL